VTVLRAYLRYVVPLTLLAVLAFAPVVLLALRVTVPGDAAQVKVTLRWAAALAGCGWLPLLVLVGAATAALDGGSQLAVLRTGLLRMLRAIVPCLAAMTAIAIGALALAVPGALLLVLLSLTGASSDRGVSAALAESVAAVRARPRHVLTVIVVTLIVAAAILTAFQLALPLPLPKKPAPEQLAAFRTYAQITVGLLALLAPLPALALATARRT